MADSRQGRDDGLFQSLLPEICDNHLLLLIQSPDGGRMPSYHVKQTICGSEPSCDLLLPPVLPTLFSYLLIQVHRICNDP